MKSQNKSVITILSFLLLLSVGLVSAQNKYDFNQFWKETGDFIAKPFSWEGSDLIKAGSIVAGTILIMQADEPVKSKMMEDRSLENRGIMRFGTIYGDATPHLALGAGLLAFGYIGENDFARQFGYEMVQAIAYTGAVTLLLKSLIGRGRPSAVDNAFTFRPFDLAKGDQFQSLPSGHSSISFAVSTVFASKVKSPWLKALCYAPAVITAASRVYNNRHWVSDVFLGAFIGHFIGKFVVDMHDSPVEISGGSSLGIRIRL